MSETSSTDSDPRPHGHGHAHGHAPDHRSAHTHGQDHDPACPDCLIEDAHHGHHDWDHFPTDAELEAAGVEVLTLSESELARLGATDRFDEGGTWGAGQPAPDLLGPAGTAGNRPFATSSGRPTRRSERGRRMANLIASYRRVRRDHRSLTESQRNAFNNALEAMDGNAAWSTLTNYHAGGVYRMHAMHGLSGRQRFLSWHRQYLFEAEQMLRTVEPTVTIPYWEYSSDGNRPDWVHQPPGVDRPTPGASGFLPHGGTISAVLARGDYTSFTTALENDAHNQVHNWCGGTLRNPSTASFDPIFWLLHSNVDRLWAIWQETHTTPVVHTPSLSGPEQVLDPWNVTIVDVDEPAWDLGYRYG